MQSAYERGKQSVADLCQTHGIKPHHLYKQAKTQGWAMRAKQKAGGKRKVLQRAAAKPKLDKGSKPKIANKKSPPHTQTLREALEFITMDLMHHIKERCREEGNYEREARTLSSLVRTYEKLTNIEAERIEAPPMKEVSDQKRNDETADGRRRELAARLEKLIQGL